ncbi:MAG: iron-containing alcohol dehydrogenase [Peptoniphilaceae bacterium]|nr:iron-containing alcohol dehydrogenase [Peptoniphilaceae bacterium]
MNQFIFHLPTMVFFGEDQADLFAAEARKRGTKALLCYGGGSIRKNGIYEDITGALKNAGITFAELSGIEPNPRLTTAIRGIELARKNDVDMIIAVGGGSTIDCAKLIAAGVKTDADPWNIVCGKARIKEALPIGAVLTIAATGSEMDGNAVITNEKTQEKLGFGSAKVIPEFSLMNPAYTKSVNAYHTAAGTADIMSHTMENYFSVEDDCFLQDSMAEGILRTCVKYGPIAVKDPENLEARQNLMWASSWAINGLLSNGKSNDWSVHGMEHELSAFYDITHGIGLAILTPHWLTHVLSKETAPKIARFGHMVFDLPKSEDVFEDARAAIAALSEFFQSLQIPMHLREVGIDESRLSEMAHAAAVHKRGVIFGFARLEEADILAIYQASL